VGDRAKARVGRADVATITDWAEQFATADRLADVFPAARGAAARERRAQRAGEDGRGQGETLNGAGS
jgi:hypothetical protein